jgi:hypothetical protein
MQLCQWYMGRSGMEVRHRDCLPSASIVVLANGILGLRLSICVDVDAVNRKHHMKRSRTINTLGDRHVFAQYSERT